MLVKTFDTIFTLISAAINVFSVVLIAAGFFYPERIVNFIMRL